MNCWENKAFWIELDALVQKSEIIIDRPMGASHPRYPGLIYPLDYGYLKNTKSSDGAEIDIWIGESPVERTDAVMCILDTHKRDSEIKVRYRCTHENMQEIYRIHNSEGVHGILIER
ncbi:inorganic pyrophosphatase [candidate division KSB1 bacterium]|nr:inorganic pyrophosphatase [candidate division KSB1 bacterium]